jgi:hypothetical protein
VDPQGGECAEACAAQSPPLVGIPVVVVTARAQRTYGKLGQVAAAAAAHPVRRHDLPTRNDAAVRHKQADAGDVARGRVERAGADRRAGAAASQPVVAVAIGSEVPPQSLRGVRGKRPAGGRLEHPTEHLRVEGGIVEAHTGRCGAGRRADHLRDVPVAQDGLLEAPDAAVRHVPHLKIADPAGHGEKLGQSGLLVSGAGEIRPVVGDPVPHTAEGAVGQGDADQKRRDGLGDGEQLHPRSRTGERAGVALVHDRSVVQNHECRRERPLVQLGEAVVTALEPVGQVHRVRVDRQRLVGVTASHPLGRHQQVHVAEGPLVERPVHDQITMPLPPRGGLGWADQGAFGNARHVSTRRPRLARPR